LGGLLDQARLDRVGCNQRDFFHRQDDNQHLNCGQAAKSSRNPIAISVEMIVFGVGFANGRYPSISCG
jgi:hypothetical protein